MGGVAGEFFGGVAVKPHEAARQNRGDFLKVRREMA